MTMPGPAQTHPADSVDTVVLGRMTPGTLHTGIVQRPTVDQRVTRLHSAIDQLEKAVDEQGIRLAPVLAAATPTPADPEGGEKRPRSDDDSWLADQIEVLAARVRNLGRRIFDTTARIDL